jgi:hypothetical protein
MISIFIETQIKSFSLHKVGNKIADEGYTLSKKYVEVEKELKDLLTHYFVSAFKSEECFQLYHESDLSLNEVFVYVSKVFDNPELLHEQSVNLAKHLYEQSTHPKIKGGEFYVVYFKDCIVDGDTVDAVGLFKSENKDTFLKVYPKGDGFEIESQKGININKLDKGCLIFNKEKENGYVVAVVDNTNKGAEAKYWTDDFLHVKPRNDEYSNTKNVLSMAKNFVLNELPQHFEVTKADQVDLLNKSVEYFKKNENFDMGTFAQEVMGQKQMIESFNTYKSEYEFACELAVLDRFAISEAAVKKQAKSLKSVIKLDKNFHIYVHGDRDMIEQGTDEEGRKYYKIYYNKES